MAYTVNYLVVGGGGSGGIYGGGGSGGQPLEGTSNLAVDTIYPIVVGAGGLGITVRNVPGNSGSPSSFNSISAIGGGAGGGDLNGGAPTIPGGGGSYAGSYGTNSTGAAANGTNTNAGGNGAGAPKYGCAGGAGAGGNGVNGTTATGGNGGPGYSSSITGAAINYAGGGGGEVQLAGTQGLGVDGGGNGSDTANGGAGTANRGGGGGASALGYTSGAGGSGIVIISYTSGLFDGHDATGGIITHSGGKTIHKFIANGNFNTSSELTGYTLRKKITIDADLIDADLAYFPVMVKLTNDAQIGAVSNADGFDIRFTDSSGTVLPYERQSFAIAGGAANAIFWVNVSEIDDTNDTDIYIYYRAADTADGSDAANTWDTNYIGVWHLEQDPSGGAPQILDSTSNARHLTSAGTMLTEDLVAAQIGNGLDFEGTNDHLNKTAADPNITNAFTIENWLYWHTTGVFQKFVQINTATTTNSIEFFPYNTNKLYCQNRNSAGAYVKAYRGATSISANTWTYGAVTYEGAGTPAMNIYFNASADTPYTKDVDNATAMTNTSRNIDVGSDNSVTFFNGVLDEVRISNICRTAAWIKASYNSGNNSLLAIGAEENLGSTTPGPFQPAPYQVNPFQIGAWR